MRLFLQGIIGFAIWCVATPIWAEGSNMGDAYTSHWLGYSALALFILAYALVMTEELTNMRKSKPVMLAAGVMWALIAAVYAHFGDSLPVAAAARHH